MLSAMDRESPVLMPHRISVIFYRVSTYQSLAKILLIVGYMIGLCLFFGIFISSQPDLPEPEASRPPDVPAPPATPGRSTTSEPKAPSPPPDADEVESPIPSQASDAAAERVRH